MDWLMEILQNTEGKEELAIRIQEKIEELYKKREEETEKRKLGDTNQKESETPEEEREVNSEKEIEELKEALKEQKIDFEIEKAILKAKGKNVKSIKALIDRSKITLKPDGTLEGLNLEEIKKTDGYLFETEKTTTYGTGMEKGNKAGKDNFKKQFEKALYRA